MLFRCLSSFFSFFEAVLGRLARQKVFLRLEIEEAQLRLLPQSHTLARSRARANSLSHTSTYARRPSLTLLASGVALAVSVHLFSFDAVDVGAVVVVARRSDAPRSRRAGRGALFVFGFEQRARTLSRRPSSRSWQRIARSTTRNRRQFFIFFFASVLLFLSSHFLHHYLYLSTNLCSTPAHTETLATFETNEEYQ